MSTFEEMHSRFMSLKYRRAVLRHLIDHVDENFRSIAGQPPKKMLLTDEKTAVPEEVFEALAAELNGLEVAAAQEVENIMKSTIKGGKSNG